MGNSQEGPAENRRHASEGHGRKRIRNGWNYDEFSVYWIKSLHLEGEGREGEEEEEDK